MKAVIIIVLVSLRTFFFDLNFSYKQAQQAVAFAIPKLHKFGIPTKRPGDYFAEMVKTDDHMQRV